MVVIRVVGQWVYEYVETLTVQHQPRHHLFELSRRKTKPELWNRMRTPRRVAQFPYFNTQRSGDRFAQLRGACSGLGVVIDMSVIAVDFDELCGSGHSRPSILFRRIFGTLRGERNKEVKTGQNHF